MPLINVVGEGEGKKKKDEKKEQKSNKKSEEKKKRHFYHSGKHRNVKITKGGGARRCKGKTTLHVICYHSLVSHASLPSPNKNPTI